MKNGKITITRKINMTIEETKQAIAVMQGHVKNKTIEASKKKENEWFSAVNPSWNFSYFDYRIKPEPHYRPFEAAKEVMEAIKEHGDWVKSEVGSYFRIVTIGDSIVWLGNMDCGIFMKNMLKDFTFYDGTPFGKLVEE